MRNLFKALDGKLRKKYRHSDQMYRFMKSSIVYWSVIIITVISVIIKYMI